MQAQPKIVPLFQMPKGFVPPTDEEAVAECLRIGLPESEAERFMAYFESVGWVVGRTQKPMVSWRGALRTWNLNYVLRSQPQQSQPNQPSPMQQRIWMRELEKAEDAIRIQKGNWPDHMDKPPEVIAEIKRLRAIVNDYKKKLGIA